MSVLICDNTPHCHTNNTKTPFIQTAVKWNHHVHTQSVGSFRSLIWVNKGQYTAV